MDEKIIQLMRSSDWKDRFRAEVMELSTRLERLDNMLEKYRNNALEFIPNCPYDILYEQSIYMRQYLRILQERSEIEDIKL